MKDNEALYLIAQDASIRVTCPQKEWNLSGKFHLAMGYSTGISYLEPRQS